MTNSAAVTGTLVRYTSTVDGCLRITIELNELEAAQFHERFEGNIINTAVVVARMREAPSTSP